MAIDQTNGSNKTIARITVPQDTNITLSIDQIDSRIIDHDDYSYSYFRVTIARKDATEGLVFVDSVLSAERNIFMENTLKAGNYIVLIESYWSNSICNKFNLGSYSD